MKFKPIRSACNFSYVLLYCKRLNNSPPPAKNNAIIRAYHLRKNILQVAKQVCYMHLKAKKPFSLRNSVL